MAKSNIARQPLRPLARSDATDAPAQPARTQQTTEDRILDVAISLFAARGFQATGIREIADSVPVTSSTLYHYIGTKSDLLFKIMQATLSCGLLALDRACSALTKPEDKLVTFV